MKLAVFVGCALGAVSADLCAQTGRGNGELPFPGNGDPQPAVAGDAVPRAHPVDRYLDIWKNSPFQRQATAPVKAVQKSFARDYAVLGMIQYGDEPVVTLINKKTRQTVRLTREEKDGFKLVKAEKGEGARDLRVTVSKDGEIGELTFDDSFLNTPAIVPRPAANPAQGRKLSGTNPNGRPLPGAPRPSITPPNRTGNVGSAASTNAPVPSKPLPPKPPATGTQSTGSAVSSPGFDTGPSSTSRRRVVLPTKSN